MPKQVTLCEPCKWLKIECDTWCEHPKSVAQSKRTDGMRVCYDGQIPIQPLWCPLKKNKPCKNK